MNDLTQTFKGAANQPNADAGTGAGDRGSQPPAHSEQVQAQAAEASEQQGDNTKPGNNPTPQSVDEYSDEAASERFHLEQNIGGMYEDDIRELNAEISFLQNTLKKSSRLRIGWLKITGQISKDPERDLNLLQSTVSMYERSRTEARQQLEERHKSNLQSEPKHDTSQLPSTKQPAMTREQAAERLAFLKDHRAEPALEVHFRPGGRTEQYVHEQNAVALEAEISALKAWLRAQPEEPKPDTPQQEPDDDHDPDPHLEPCL